jgi:uncharacterized glyoxalase superfamily protein PhnB
MASAFPQVVPYLYYSDANKALEFLKSAFGFAEHSVTRDDQGTVWTAQLSTGSGLVMIGPGIDDFGTRPVPDHEWASSRVHVLVEDLDAHYQRSVAAGATICSEPTAHFGDVRIYVASDCGGQQWIFAEPVAA